MSQCIPISMLRVGDGVNLSSAIHDVDGRMLVGAGVKLTQSMVDRLKQRGIDMIVVDDQDALGLQNPRPASARRPRSSSRSRRTPSKPSAKPGSSESHSGDSPQGDRATRPTSSVQDRKKAQASRASRPSVESGDPSPDPEGSAKRSSKRSRARRARAAPLMAASPDAAFLTTCKRHGAAPYDPATLARFAEARDGHVLDLEAFSDSLLAAQDVNVNKVASISDDTMSQISEDRDLCVVLAGETPSMERLCRFSLDVSTLAIAIGTTMGLKRAALRELCIGCLVHDVGMATFDDDGCPHTESRFALGELANHPIATMRLLQKGAVRIPKSSLYVIHQMHERCDGSGYPHGRAGRDIHELAKIAAVADTYTALIAPSRHRTQIRPYNAIEEILSGVKRGLYDSSVVRALLDTVSVFPIGSYVELSDKRHARVIRAKPCSYTKPIVQTCGERDPNALVIDIATHARLRILRPIDPEPSLTAG